MTPTNTEIIDLLLEGYSLHDVIIFCDLYSAVCRSQSALPNDEKDYDANFFAEASKKLLRREDFFQENMNYFTEVALKQWESNLKIFASPIQVLKGEMTKRTPDNISLICNSIPEIKVDLVDLCKKYSNNFTLGEKIRELYGK